MPKYTKITEEFKLTKEYEIMRANSRERSRKYYYNNIEKCREKTSKWHKANPELSREQLYQWRKDNPDKLYDIVKRYKEKYPEKEAAHNAVEWAVRVGRLIVPKICPKCNEKKKLDAHHHDYSKPLEVEWMCRACHKDEHLKGVA